jgi:hypothetical protein
LKLSFNADLQHVSSFVHPDVNDIIAARASHAHCLKSVVAQKYSLDEDEGVMMEDPGVPLLLPLTVSLEFEQLTGGQCPKERSLAVNVEPLSAMLGSEDLQLIHSVVRTLSRKPKGSVPRPERSYVYDAVFESERLGLGLRKEDGRIVVDDILDATKHRSIETGDVLHAINGVLIADLPDLTLSEMVNRLISEPRPLTVTFSREVQNAASQFENGLSVAGVETGVYYGTIDKIDVSLSAAVITLTEKEAHLFKGSLSSMKLRCHLERRSDTMLRLDLSGDIGIDYYNLRIWDWEPLLEQSGLFLSTMYQQQSFGRRELALEIGDRLTGICMNFTDSFTATLSKLFDWGRGESVTVSDEIVFGESFIQENVPSGSFRQSKQMVTTKAANAALLFAERQKNDTVKPFVFRNRAGLSIAFVQQRKRGRSASAEAKPAFVAVGEYSGLQSYDPSEIFVVAHGEELKFRVDVLSTSESKSNRDSQLGGSLSRFPSLTVALQETTGVIADPFEDLQMVRPGESAFPLTFTVREDGSKQIVRPEREWVTWLVEQADEKTIVTLGSSIRVASLLAAESVEIGIELGTWAAIAADDSRVRSLGIIRTGEPFCLPLWLALQRTRWRCSARLSTGYRYASLFEVTSAGLVIFGAREVKIVECRARKGDAPSAWLAVAQHKVDGILTFSIDCSLSIRNLLPTDIEWEVRDDSSASIVDGSTVRERHSGKPQHFKSGEYAEILYKDYHSLQIRLKPTSDSSWSSWTTISFPTKRVHQGTNEEAMLDGYDESVVDGFIKTKDVFNVPQQIGLRFVRKECGLHVTFYAELWLSNCTSLKVVFGCPKEEITGFRHESNDDDAKRSGMSTAEAALQEISAIFECAQEGTGLRQIANLSREIDDVVRLVGQVAPLITEECFEYIIVEGSSVTRRWWASEDPSSPRQDVSVAGQDIKGIVWVDQSWVSPVTQYLLFVRV